MFITVQDFRIKTGKLKAHISHPSLALNIFNVIIKFKTLWYKISNKLKCLFMKILKNEKAGTKIKASIFKAVKVNEDIR